MKYSSRIMSEFERSGHPLGKSIEREQIPSLVTRLRQRLAMSESELDLTPRSLKLLEAKLLELPPDKQPSSLEDEDVVRFVREIAGYVGEVLLTHTDMRWEPSGTLWGNHLVLEGQVKVFKEGHRRIESSVVFSLGNIATAALDMASLGKRPLLYRDYASAKRKEVKEDLHLKK